MVLDDKDDINMNR